MPADALRPGPSGSPQRRPQGRPHARPNASRIPGSGTPPSGNTLLKPGQIPGLTGLRGLAALGVFLVHYNQIVRLDPFFGPFDLAYLLANGGYGVALFLVLSGFLLSLPYWQARQGGPPPPRTGAYLLKRMLRILPAYLAVLSVLILGSRHWLIPGAWADILLHLLFLFNLTEFSIFSLNPAFWTLALEMQLYLLVPPCGLLLLRVSQRLGVTLLVSFAILGYLGQLSLVQLVDTIIPWPLNPQLLWLRPGGAVLSHSVLAHLPHFMIGILAAPCYLKLQKRKGVHPGLISRSCDRYFWTASCLLALLLATPGLEPILTIPQGRYGLPLVPLLLAGVLITLPCSRYAAAIFEWKPLKLFGLLSYGFYLWHQPSLHYSDRLLSSFELDCLDQPGIFAVLSLSLALGAAGLSYLLVERPLLRCWKKRLQRRA